MAEVRARRPEVRGVRDQKSPQVNPLQVAPDGAIQRGKDLGPGELDSKHVLVTLHRPSNVDDSKMLVSIMKALQKIAHHMPVVFPVHPRTRLRIADCGLQISEKEKLYLMDPVGYIEFLALQKSATVVITDSGGIQEETTVLRVPCLTIRESGGRPLEYWLRRTWGTSYKKVNNFARVIGSKERSES